MIAACPKCGARYRIERSRLRPEGARVRCSRCEVAFRVRPPPQRAEGERSSQEAASGVRTAAAPPPPVEASQAVAPDVVIADADVEFGSALANTMTSWGLRPLLVHDGVEAILGVQRALPVLVILDAGLPKMLGFQVCELIKRNESLKSIQVVLIGAIHLLGVTLQPGTEGGRVGGMIRWGLGVTLAYSLLALLIAGIFAALHRARQGPDSGKAR